jgi:hypothetical protein
MHVIDINTKHGYAKHEFDMLSVPAKGNLKVRKAEMSDTEEASILVASHLKSATVPVSYIQEVIDHNNDGFFLFEKNERIVGLYVMLMLNGLGLEKLLLGELNISEPPLETLAKSPLSTSAIYVWAYVAPGMAANGIRYVSSFLNGPDYKHANFFARPVTPLGLQISENLGFQPIEGNAEGLYRYTRLINRNLNVENQE